DLVVDQLALEHRDGGTGVALPALREGRVGGDVVAPYAARLGLRITDVPHVKLAEGPTVAQVCRRRAKLRLRRQADREQGHESKTGQQSAHESSVLGANAPARPTRRPMDCAVGA